MQASKGWSLLDRGSPDEAIVAFEKSKEKQELPGYYLGMYNAYLDKKDINKAVSYLSEGLKRYPEDFHLNFAMGSYLLASRKPILALKYFEKCKSLNPGSANEILERSIEQANDMLKINK